MSFCMTILTIEFNKIFLLKLSYKNKKKWLIFFLKNEVLRDECANKKVLLNFLVKLS